MGMIKCARCGATDDEASASYAEDGLICARCYQGVAARDAAQMNAEVRFAEGVAHPHGLGRALGAVGEMLNGPQFVVSTTTRTVTRAGGGQGAPPSGLHAELGARGATVQRATVEKRVKAGPFEGMCDGYREVWTLPTAPVVQARFSHENLDSKVVKLFRKEIQTGDAAFDAAVYIRTDTAEATTALLARPEVRALIGPVVSRGGHVTIKGNVVEGEALWPVEEPGPRPQDLFAQVVGILLGG